MMISSVVNITGEDARRDVLTAKNFSAVDCVMMRSIIITNGTRKRVTKCVDTMSKKLNVMNVIIYRDHNRIAKTAEYSLLPTSVVFAIYSMMKQ